MYIQVSKCDPTMSSPNLRISLKSLYSVIPAIAGIQEYNKIMNKNYYAYVLASKRNGTLYIGITSELTKRVWEHKNKLVEGFTEKYSVDKLVYYEQTS